MHRHRLHNGKGFTLFELLVVMVLISLTVTFAVPSLRTALYTDELKETARKIIGLVEQTSQRAFREQRSYLLSYDQGKETLTARPQNIPMEQEQRIWPAIRLPSGVHLASILSYHGGNLSLTTGGLLFTRQGYVDFALIHLADTNGRGLTVMLSPFLGVSRTYEGLLELDDETLPLLSND
ncbi:MAG: hypothetical protein CSA34_02835 [Desulfobulbus propionicus]|nr:MAG: hypothetical protein CSA34_02835 [Desulfobulbus propionicus]